VKRSVALTVVLLACGVAVITLWTRHLAIERRSAAAAIDTTLNAHSDRISALLSEMSASSERDIRDAVWHELQSSPSTSLITRDDIRLDHASGSSLRCIVESRVVPSSRRVIVASESR
jgi:hypothetical protein